MAKSATRVHLLAKELGVKSKSIVEKCQAEGLDIKNHMSTISVGLAATIREWFSEGEHDTAVETSKRVDLKKVRVPKKRAKKKIEPVVAEPVEDIAEATVEAPAVEAEPQAAEGEVAPEPVSEIAADAEAPAKAKGKGKAASKKKAVSKKKKKTAPSGPVFVEHPEPEKVIPAGPMLTKPKPAKLSGPNVIRVEKIEKEAPRREVRPRKSRGPRPDYNAPISEPLMPAAEGTGKGGRKGRDKTHGRRRDGAGGGAGGATKKVDPSTKRMRTRDLEERKARLAAARGESSRYRPSRKIEARKAADVGVQVDRPEKANVSEPITVKDLSSAIMVRSGQIIAKLMSQGVMAAANQVIDTEVAEMIALEFGTELTV
ncbi:MAG: translation initiation factor IF-2 N-terminal domain-containing protein, partial [Planctomycetes bacterium]|nr:translation initiation factor IF-2 N-terminal domain-containing protein [Planctomycetota bacterium]